MIGVLAAARLVIRRAGRGLLHLALLPFTSEDNLRLGERERRRSRVLLALERWKTATTAGHMLPIGGSPFQSPPRSV